MNTLSTTLDNSSSSLSGQSNVSFLEFAIALVGDVGATGAVDGAWEVEKSSPVRRNLLGGVYGELVFNGLIGV